MSILKVKRIAIIGMGYIGLPLSLNFSKHFDIVGYDTNIKRISELNNGKDFNNQIKNKILKNPKKLKFTHKINDISNCNIFIIAVPTPILISKKPNLKPIKKATEMISKLLKKDDIIIYESTVFPGTVEDICVPIIEKYSKKKYNKDFYCGYSPERLNPGSDQDDLSKIVKITSGSNRKASIFIDKLYKKIIKSGTFMMNSIKEAEAAKVIENAQRDLNIAFINELFLIFEKLNLNTYNILKGASTKWNFQYYSPGLVGGHCIGVDPYYLTHKSIKSGYNPKVILSGRKINDDMSKSISKIYINNLRKNFSKINKLKILLLGFTFKEDCKDIRNTKVYDVYNFLRKKFLKIDIFDPVADNNEVFSEYKIKLINNPEKNYYDGIVILVPHIKFINMGPKKIFNLGKSKCLIFDFKNMFNNNIIFLKNEFLSHR